MTKGTQILGSDLPHKDKERALEQLERLSDGYDLIINRMTSYLAAGLRPDFETETDVPYRGDEE